MSLPAPFRCAIFDMDGTVLDSMPVWDTLGEDYLRSCLLYTSRCV